MCLYFRKGSLGHSREEHLFRVAGFTVCTPSHKQLRQGFLLLMGAIAPLAQAECGHF